ncbi:MAG: hypothetical protein NC215_00225 [Ruminococcus sp.]|nr:hypothetical protein [Ruminococcus sp.]
MYIIKGLKGFTDESLLRFMELIEDKVNYLKSLISKKSDTTYVDEEIQKLRNEILNDVLGGLSFSQSNQAPTNETDPKHITFVS